MMLYGGDFCDSFSSGMKIRGRGNSTWFYHEKKSYQMKLDEKEALLNLPKHKKWLLVSNHADRSLIRNRFALELGHRSNLGWTPKTEYVEVYVNNQYNGVYLALQKVEEGENRLNIGKQGFLLEFDPIWRLDEDDVFFKARSDFSPESPMLNIKEPEVAYHDANYQLIEHVIGEFERALNGDAFAEPTLGYAKHIDIESFVDWYLINEITKNQDSKDFSSIYLHYVPGDKIKMGPLWDFDLAFGNVNYSDCQYYEGFWIKDHAWYKRLFQDPAFVQKVKERFQYFLAMEGEILEFVDQEAYKLRYAHEHNSKRWSFFVEGESEIWPVPVMYNTYEEEVEHVKTWYSNRLEWLDNAFTAL